MSGLALPPDVRRGLCPAGSSQIINGLCPWSGLSPSGAAGNSHRHTSGGKAEAAALHFSNLFLSKNANTASLNSFGFSIITKWPTPSHI